MLGHLMFMKIQYFLSSHKSQHAFCQYQALDMPDSSLSKTIKNSFFTVIMKLDHKGLQSTPF
jgi:hypothetical protein